MEPIATIKTFSSNGFDSPVFKDSLPKELEEVGVTQSQWTSFLKEANDAAQFQWGLGTICCFFCNQHNKNVAKKLTQFAESYKDLPQSIKVHYEMKTEKQSVAVYPGGSGATLETFHKLIFSKK